MYFLFPSFLLPLSSFSPHSFPLLSSLPAFLLSSLCLYKNLLSIYYVPGTRLGTGDTTENQTDLFPAHPLVVGGHTVYEVYKKFKKKNIEWRVEESSRATQFGWLLGVLSHMTPGAVRWVLVGQSSPGEGGICWHN